MLQLTLFLPLLLEMGRLYPSIPPHPKTPPLTWMALQLKHTFPQKIPCTGASDWSCYNLLLSVPNQKSPSSVSSSPCWSFSPPYSPLAHTPTSEKPVTTYIVLERGQCLNEPKIPKEEKIKKIPSWYWPSFYAQLIIGHGFWTWLKIVVAVVIVVDPQINYVNLLDRGFQSFTA